MNQLIPVITITKVVNQQTTTTNNGLDTNAMSHVTPITAQRKCMLNTHPLVLLKASVVTASKIYKKKFYNLIRKHKNLHKINKMR